MIPHPMNSSATRKTRPEARYARAERMGAAARVSGCPSATKRYFATMGAERMP